MLLTKTQEKIINTAIHGYGIDNQRLKCLEELAELSKELCKDGIGKGNKAHIAEEIADVEIMLEQMKVYYGIDDAVRFSAKIKLEQLGERVGVLNAEN